MARPKFEPGDKDAASVEAMVAYGIPQENIALVIGCDAKTLRKYFRREIDTGATKMIAKVGEANYKAAIGGNVGAQCFILKCRAGWREQPQRLEHGGIDGAAIKVEHSYDLSRLTLEQLRALEAIIAAADPGDGEDGAGGEKPE